MTPAGWAWERGCGSCWDCTVSKKEGPCRVKLELISTSWASFNRDVYVQIAAAAPVVSKWGLGRSHRHSLILLPTQAPGFLL